MLAGKSLLGLANNIEVLACNRSGEPKQCATVSSIYQTNERNFWFRSDRPESFEGINLFSGKNEVR